MTNNGSDDSFWKSKDYRDLFANVLQQEADAILSAKNLMSSAEGESSIDFLIQIYSRLKLTRGSLVFCGVGKSGIVAMKLASTFSSLGLPSFYLHPVDALHGDLGRLGEDDAVCYLSKSGTTEEIVRLLPFVRVPKDMTIGILGQKKGAIAENCGVIFDASVEKEACINNLAPTTSSTLALALGDSMAVVYEKFVGLNSEKFALNHPAGILGKMLRLRVEDILVPLRDCPRVSPKDSFDQVILQMTGHPVGLCFVLSGEEFKGIIVEGDIRRTFSQYGDKSTKLEAEKVMTLNPLSGKKGMLAYEALELMEGKDKKVYVLPIFDEENRVLGALRMHDLMGHGLISAKSSTGKEKN